VYFNLQVSFRNADPAVLAFYCNYTDEIGGTYSMQGRSEK